MALWLFSSSSSSGGGRGCQWVGLFAEEISLIVARLSFFFARPKLNLFHLTSLDTIPASETVTTIANYTHTSTLCFSLALTLKATPPL